MYYPRRRFWLVHRPPTAKLVSIKLGPSSSVRLDWADVLPLATSFFAALKLSTDAGLQRVRSDQEFSTILCNNLGKAQPFHIVVFMFSKSKDTQIK